MRHFLLLLLALSMLGCDKDGPKIEPRLKPAYVGVDKTLQPILAEYVKLAKQSGIKFKRPISMGFADINVPVGTSRVVGICFNYQHFREIDIDKKQWRNHSEISGKSLLFHELTHCLCNRNHDYGDGHGYPSIEVEEMMDFIYKYPFYLPRPGRYADGCPLSIMYTHVLPDSCLVAHRQEYWKEMFNRCKPW